MTITFKEFINKYHLDKINNALELRGEEKVEFYNDFIELMRRTCKIFDKLANIASLRGGQVLMSLAKLQGTGTVINKTDVMHSLNIDRLEKLFHAFEYLERENYINIEKKTEKFHILTLNEEDNPDLILFKEVVEKFWLTPEEELNKTKRWIEL